MKIKSLEELKKIKEDAQNKVRLRKQGEGESNKVEILIGMATCGISSGARETLNTFVEELAKEKIENTKVISVGCIGYCHSEPTVEVLIKGQEPVLYGNVKEKQVKEIIEKHIKGNQPVDRLRIKADFKRV